MKKDLAKNPFFLFIYIFIAVVLVANIFLSGYWIGRKHQLSENSNSPQAQAQSTPLR